MSLYVSLLLMTTAVFAFLIKSWAAFPSFCWYQTIKMASTSCRFDRFLQEDTLMEFLASNYRTGLLQVQINMWLTLYFTLLVATISSTSPSTSSVRNVVIHHVRTRDTPLHLASKIWLSQNRTIHPLARNKSGHTSMYLVSNHLKSSYEYSDHFHNVRETLIPVYT